VEKDPNAPKKPANPFLQFCKEQRMMTNELLRGASDINKQELNKVLCNRWKTLAQEEKKVYTFYPVCSGYNNWYFQIYYDKYELEKQQYSLEVEMYDRQKGGGMMGSLPAELFDLP
jgi:non-histone protein 10